MLQPGTSIPTLSSADLDASLVGAELVASGSYGDIYKARWDSRDAAIKKLKPTPEPSAPALPAQDFLQEAELLRSLQHPSIVRLYAICLDPCALILEWCSGGNLKDYLHEQKNALSSTERLKWALQVAEGLSYLHSRKVIHRDVKAENVLLDTHRRAKLTDFGLSKVKASQMRRDSSAPDLATLLLQARFARADFSSRVVGTPAWVAPEMMQQQQYTEKVDVYSYGIFLWELLTREVPWDTKDPYEILTGVLAGERPPVPEGQPSALSSLMQRCWAQSADARPSMAEVAATLSSLRSAAEDSTGSFDAGML